MVDLKTLMYFFQLVADSYIKKAFGKKQSDILPTTVDKSDLRPCDTRLDMESSKSSLQQRRLNGMAYLIS